MKKQQQPFKFRVQGRGEFPYDMLRYDECRPASEADSALMGYHRGIDDPSEVRGLELVCYGLQITPARWNSFGWLIVQSKI